MSFHGWRPDDYTFSMCSGSPVVGGIVATPCDEDGSCRPLGKTGWKQKNNSTLNTTRQIVFLECQPDVKRTMETWIHNTAIHTSILTVLQPGHLSGMA
jgi:hypothetical protein